MSSEILLRKNTDLMAFAEEAARVHSIAKALATTSFVPASMKGKPDEITGAILYGKELGMDPMTSLQTINVIQGRPTLTANAMRGLAMAGGVRFKLEDATETRCVMSAMPSYGGEWTTVTWHIDQAKKLGLTSKDNWKNQPGAMLIARATSQLCRLVAADILIGSPYSSEEVRDMPLEAVHLANTPPPESETKTRVVRRQPKPVQDMPVEEPELIPENEVPLYATGTANLPEKVEPPKEIVGYVQVDEEKRTGPEEPVERPDMVTTETRKALMARFNDLGIRERTARLARVSEILAREVLTVNQVTETEARRILDVLSWDKPGVPS